MTDNEQVIQEIKPILDEVSRILAAVMEAKNIPDGIQFGLILKDKGYTLHFMREPRFDADTQTQSTHLAGIDAVGTD